MARAQPGRQSLKRLQPVHIMMKGYHASTLTSGKDPLGSSAPVGDLSEARSTGRTRLRFRLDRSPPLLGPASALEFSMVVDGERELYPPAGELHTSHAVRSFCPAECVEWNCVVFWNKRGAPHHAPTTNSQIGCDLAFTKQDPLTGRSSRRHASRTGSSF